MMIMITSPLEPSDPTPHSSANHNTRFAEAATIMRVSPSMGSEAGGTLVSLYGEAFSEPLSCRCTPNPLPLSPDPETLTPNLETYPVQACSVP